MSENTQKPTSETSGPKELSEEFVLRVNAAKNEIQLLNPQTGKTTSLRAEIVQGDEGATLEDKWQQPKQLTFEQFVDAWTRLEKLGITWTTDIPPNPVFRTGFSRDESFWRDYLAVQHEFPNFPRELASVVLHALLHPVSNKANLQKKTELISGLLTQEYRSEFFFKYAIKVPYLEDMDWEVVVKAYERGVHSMPKIAYALVNLTFRNPVDTTLSVEEGANEKNDPEFITVAVNEKLVATLSKRLTDIRSALEKAQQAADTLTEREIQKEEVNANGPNVS